MEARGDNARGKPCRPFDLIEIIRGQHLSHATYSGVLHVRLICAAIRARLAV